MSTNRDVVGIDNILPKDYSRFLIKEYPLWSVYAHENQGYLGRCYIWCKREDARDFPDATNSEVLELWEIVKRINTGLALAFNPTMLNYAMLGNVTRHLHCHVIPRYQQPIEFAGVSFEDKRWGQNYQIDRSFKTQPELLDQIIDQMKRYIV